MQLQRMAMHSPASASNAQKKFSERGGRSAEIAPRSHGESRGIAPGQYARALPRAAAALGLPPGILRRRCWQPQRASAPELGASTWSKTLASRTASSERSLLHCYSASPAELTPGQPALPAPMACTTAPNFHCGSSFYNWLR